MDLRETYGNMLEGMQWLYVAVSYSPCSLCSSRNSPKLRKRKLSPSRMRQLKRRSWVQIAQFGLIVSFSWGETLTWKEVVTMAIKLWIWDLSTVASHCLKLCPSCVWSISFRFQCALMQLTSLWDIDRSNTWFHLEKCSAARRMKGT